ncbi:MAG: META domain-containing protein [Ignavibacteriaceae bacterium]|jgi:heat shock protein HslJ|nr:META domain-containing protein [Ignavibacteriaceae bacterium]MCW8817761.1 META domain-containing protein [Ignavibacteriaceae bacterium]MCW8823754.1 META domain-containing protein [Ignavibacteriaceae bacterium]MCW8995421.1 META domain-containing protein [Psychromonas sp.]MCW9097101.1 META domain-containing protein [Ignavibacteriaceae bacterium]
MKSCSVSFILIALIIISCSSKEAEKSQVNLLHDIWALASINSEKVVIDETVKNLPKLEIYVEDEMVRGNTGCNTINGKVEIDKNKISFYDITATEMVCPGDLERRFISALQKVNNYKIVKFKLYLYENDKVLLSFQKID